MRFRAAVLHEVGGPVVVQAVDAGPLGPTDVLVRNAASGLCHTDLEVIQGAQRYPLPIVLGHEGAGVVEAVGPAVTQVRPGDHVICAHNASCGRCFYCDTSSTGTSRGLANTSGWATTARCFSGTIGSGARWPEPPT
ncbi:MAG TPA: alcohol dehydrogenase catalytic domain-containing protein [Methylomirabilota bacterium]|nr:alcohol dehydrogenase catalytic domain-containing protein [Methylomirabilota bacterium]